MSKGTKSFLEADKHFQYHTHWYEEVGGATAAAIDQRAPDQRVYLTARHEDSQFLGPEGWQWWPQTDQKQGTLLSPFGHIVNKHNCILVTECRTWELDNIHPNTIEGTNGNKRSTHCPARGCIRGILESNG